jgi:hypothetical protein
MEREVPRRLWEGGRNGTMAREVGLL